MPRKAKPRVEYSVKRTATFCYDACTPEAPAEYRHVGDGRWVNYEACAADDTLYEESDYGRATEQIADSMIAELVGLACITEACDHPMGPWVAVDLDACKYTAESVRDAIEAIVDHVVAGKPVESAKAPYIRNRSGNPNYNDPEQVVPPFVPPQAARDLLAKKPRPTGKR